MAEKRMFSKKIIDTDWFMDMPASTQNLYFHLSMRADDDGFVANPKRIIKLVGASEDDYKLLIAKKFIIVFDSGICVIKDWRINNYLRADRYTETIYQEEKSQLSLGENEEYLVGIPSGIPLVSTELTNSNSNTNTNSINNKIDEYGFTSNIKDAVKNWLEYKKEKKQGYKPKGLQILLNRIKKDYEQYGEQYVLDEIEYSMTSNYSGIFAQNSHNKPTTPAQDYFRQKNKEYVEENRAYLERDDTELF